jgi:hypothetical protein
MEFPLRNELRHTSRTFHTLRKRPEEVMDCFFYYDATVQIILGKDRYVVARSWCHLYYFLQQEAVSEQQTFPRGWVY